MVYKMIYSPAGITEPDEQITFRAKTIFEGFKNGPTDNEISIGTFEIIHRVTILFMEDESMNVTDIVIEYNGETYAVDEYGRFDMYDHAPVMDEEFKWISRKIEMCAKIAKEKRNGQKDTTEI